MIALYVGIDPSVNSTGMTIRDDKGFVRFFIVKGGKLTKKEVKAEEENREVFSYKLYDKTDVSTAETAYHREMIKAGNLRNIANTVVATIVSVIKEYSTIYTEEVDEVYVCMEGISYGSVRSSAVMDLAGLNYLIRDRLISESRITRTYIAPPAEIKKFATGSGNANKDLMIAAFAGTWPDLTLPKVDDVCDSWFMSRYAQYKEEQKSGSM